MKLDMSIHAAYLTDFVAPAGLKIPSAGRHSSDVSTIAGSYSSQCEIEYGLGGAKLGASTESHKAAAAAHLPVLLQLCHLHVESILPAA